MFVTDIEQHEKIFTVSDLNRQVKSLLEEGFSSLWIEGEISNFSTPQSGHWYFSLKDANAQVRCAMFKMRNRKLNFTPKDGTHVLIKARVSLYEARGDFQLLAEEMEERGEGKLRQAFEALKKKLQAAGLFDADRKKLLPTMPKQIGVITSATGAAIRDILTVLKRRFPCVPVIIYPTLVQGELAAANIVNAMQIANQRAECDVLILARGGGSLEDLWPFNEEKVALAIYQSHIPTISGVGHEVDFTIADFVADQRAPTPSAAAEMAVPDREELLPQLLQNEKRTQRCIQQKIQQLKQQLLWAQKHIHQQHPKRRLQEKMQQLDFNELTLVRLQKQLLTQLQNRLKTAAAKLDALSPLATLQRGFAIATREDGSVLRRAKDVAIHEKIQVRLQEGVLKCEVV